MNPVGRGQVGPVHPGNPTPRSATAFSITTNARDGVGEPFRLTFTFTDEEHDDTRFGVTGFEVGDIAVSYSSPTYYEFTLEDFRGETTGLVGQSAPIYELLTGR